MTGFTRPAPEVAEGLNKGWDMAQRDGATAPQLPIDQKVTAYIRDVVANMRAKGDLD